MTDRRHFVPEQYWRAVQVGHQQVLTAAIPEVGGQRGTADIFFSQGTARLLAHFFKPSVFQVVKQKRALSITHSERLPLNLRIDVAVRDEDVRPAIVVVVEKLRAEPQIGIADGANPGRSREVGELPVVIVLIEVVVVVRKIGLEDIGPAVAIVVVGVDAHPGLLVSVGTISQSRLGPNFGEAAFAIVVIKQARRRIVGHVEIEAAILVVIKPEYAETVVAIGIDSEFLGDVGKSTVAVVVIEAVASAFESARAAVHGDAAILAEDPTAKFRQIVDIDVDIVGNIEIEVAVVVVVSESCARAPAIGVGNACLGSDIRKGSVVIIVVER